MHVIQTCSFDLILRLEHDFVLAIECNYMKLNQDKYYLLILGHNY